VHQLCHGDKHSELPAIMLLGMAACSIPEPHVEVLHGGDVEVTFELPQQLDIPGGCGCAQARRRLSKRACVRRSDRLPWRLILLQQWW
jgi:hypothetical protein